MGLGFRVLGVQGLKVFGVWGLGTITRDCIGTTIGIHSPIPPRHQGNMQGIRVRV